MSLIDDDEIWLPVLTMQSPCERLHRCNLHRMIGFRVTSRDHTMGHAGKVQLRAGLQDQLTPVDEDQHAAATICGASGDR